MYLIKEMPKRQRPRERLIEFGAQALSNDELLAIILRTGHQHLSVIDLAKKVLYHLETLQELKKITFEELLMIKGIKDAKATLILAAIELGKRLAADKKEVRPVIYQPNDIYFYLREELSILEQEHFICLFLNTKNELIRKETIFIGTVNQTLIHPREIFRFAVKLSSHAVIFVHNHPTGDSRPSQADLIATNKLIEAGNLMGIHVLDHVIIGKRECYSIQEEKRYHF